MPRLLRTVTKKIFIIANLVVVLFFLLACLNAFLHPAKWWFFALLGLSFPFLLILVLFFVLFWATLRSKWTFLNIVVLILGYTNIRALVGLHLFRDDFQQEKSVDAIRVLSWNVSWFDEQTKEVKRESNYRKEMLDFIRRQNADVLCFQEYLEPNSPGYYNNAKEISALGYPYHFFASDYSRKNGSFQVGVAIFSRYPIKDSFQVAYSGPKTYRAAESLIGADIEVNNETYRIFNTHLQSVLFQKKDYRNLEIIKKAEDSIMEASRSVVRKLKMAYSFRGDQSDLVRSWLDKSEVPVIICGDFNDVPNSYTYFRIKGSRNDAFVETSRGLGRTFFAISPTLRIDYIFADERINVLQYKREILPYSDHYPLVADFRLPSASTEE